MRNKEHSDGKQEHQEQIDALNLESQLVRAERPREACELARRALETARRHGYRHGELMSMINVAEALIRLSQTAEATEMLGEALEQARNEENKVAEAAALYALGSYFRQAGELREALRHLRQSLQLFEETDQREDCATVKSGLGIIYMYLGDRANGIELTQEALDYFIEIGDRKRQTHCLMNISIAYRNFDNSKKALESMRRCLAIYREIGNRHGEAVGCLNIGVELSRYGNYSEALPFLHEALKHCRAIEHVEHEINCLHGLAEVYSATGRTKEALDLYRQALDLAERNGRLSQCLLSDIGIGTSLLQLGKTDKALERLLYVLGRSENADRDSYLSNLYHAISEAYEAKGDYQNSLKYYKLCHETERRVINEHSDEKIQNLMILHDTEQAHKEVEINRLKNVELAEANAHLEQLVRSRNEFLGIVAHDLKNPIDNIRALARLIRSDIASHELISARELCYDVEQSAERMFNLVSNLLDINRIDQGRLSISRRSFNLSETSRRFMAVYTEHARKKDIKLVFHTPGPEVLAYADPDVTVQVIDNLVSNAVKYSPSGTSVYLSTTMNHTQQGLRARLEVRDEGPGIAVGEMENLFKKFARLSSRPTGGESSTGLGLSIVKQLVEAMDGQVWCESEAGEGATFIVELPAVSKSVKSGLVAAKV